MYTFDNNKWKDAEGKFVSNREVEARRIHLELDNEELRSEVAQLKTERQTLQQQVEQLKAAKPSDNSQPSWQQRFLPGVVAVFAVAAIVFLLRWLFTVNINLTSVNAGVLALLAVLIFLIPQFFRWIRSKHNNQESSDSDQSKQTFWQWMMGNIKSHRRRSHRGGE